MNGNYAGHTAATASSTPHARRHHTTRGAAAQSPQPLKQARTAAAEMLDRMRTLVDNVSVALDGPPPTRTDKLIENWARIQEHFSRQEDLSRLRITDTTIPHHLELMLRLLAREMLDSGTAPLQPLEFGPCVEYLLQYHILTDLVDLASVDLPRGMRKYVVLFFDHFIECIPLGLLPESAIRLPLVAIMRQCASIVQTSPTAAKSDTGARLGHGYHGVPSDRAAVVLSHDLLKLIVTVFRRLREHATMVDLFFDWDSEPPVRSSELAVASLRAVAAASVQSTRGHELFLVHTVIEYLLAPGATGQLAREALVLIVQVLLAPQDRSRYVGFLLDQARVPELLVEHIGYLYAQMPVFRPMPRSPDAHLFTTEYRGLREIPPLRRRMTTPSVDTDIKPRLSELLARDAVLRSVAQQDQREAQILAASHFPEHVDMFFICWELLDELTFCASSDSRVVAAVQSQLTNGFLRTHIEPALLSTMASRSQAITTVSYLTDLVALTHSTSVLDALFAVLLGSDLGPELLHQEATAAAAAAAGPRGPTGLSLEDQELLDSIEDDALRAEAAALLGTSQVTEQPRRAQLRDTLIGWMTEDNTHLSLSTLRLFDAILASMNQFAITSLVLRNFGDAVEGPALGLGASVAADQEMVRAVVERFIDATPTHISSAMPEAVVAAAMRLEGTGGSSEAILEPRGCDDYVGDCLDRLRFNQEYIAKCWVPKSAFIPLEQDNSSGGMYPGVFLTSLIGQFGLVVRRHMAYNLLLTSMVTRLAALADPGVCAFLFLANSTVVPTEHPRLCFLYDALVQASADAYVKSERVPRFAARLARQRREGVETAIRVGAAHPRAQELVSNVDSSSRPQASSGLMDVDPVQQKDVVTKNRAEAVRAAAFLGTPIKRFVHGYIVLDEFGKEMAAMAMALHTLELDRMMDRSGLVDVKEDLAELLEYYDPEEPGYKQMAMVHQMLRAHRMSIIELGQNHPK